MAAFDPYYEWLGIPPKDQPPHHYRLLGIELYESHLTAIDAAANRIMAYLQELSNGENGALAQQLLNEVSAARVCLLNKKRKATYDQTLKTKLSNKKQKKKNKPATVKTPPPLPVAIPVEPAEESTFSETGIPQISTEDSHPGSSLGTSSRRTNRRTKQGENRTVLIVIGLLLIVAIALGVYSWQQPQAPSKTGKKGSSTKSSSKRALNESNVISKAREMVTTQDESDNIDFKKQLDITGITVSLIRPHWRQIAAAKMTKRTECYQLAITHAKKLLEDHGSVDSHRDKRAGTSKQPLNFDPRANREAEKSYHDKYGKEFDTELDELLDTSE